MDITSMELANMLVGNVANEAVLEMHFPAPVIEFEKTALAVLTGADFQACCEENKIPVGRPFVVKKGERLRFRKHLHGMRCYLAVKGGFDVPTWLGSASPRFPGEAGLYRGQQVSFRARLKDPPHTGPCSWYAAHPVKPGPILFLPGAHWEMLTDRAKQDIGSIIFVQEQQSGRMAHYFSHKALERSLRTEILSEAVDRGTMQLLPSGKLIILAADHQTTGGYPVLGHVIRAHASRLAQIRTGEELRFGLTDPATAMDLNNELERKMRQLREACRLQLEKAGI
jgi:antagonist of KipI